MKTATANTLELIDNINIMFNQALYIHTESIYKYYKKTLKLINQITRNQFLIIKNDLIRILNTYKYRILNKIFKLNLIDEEDVYIIISILFEITKINDNINAPNFMKYIIKNILFLLLYYTEGSNEYYDFNYDKNDIKIIKNIINNKRDKYKKKEFDIILNKKLKYSYDKYYEKHGLYNFQKTNKYIIETYFKYFAFSDNIYEKEEKYFIKYISLVNLESVFKEQKL